MAGTQSVNIFLLSTISFDSFPRVHRVGVIVISESKKIDSVDSYTLIEKML